MKIVILTEGSKEKGFGHVARCSSIYQAFSEFNYPVELIINGDSSIGSILQNIKYTLFNWLNNKEELFNKLDSSDIVIVDSYFTDTNFYEEISEKINLLISLDDNNRLDYAKGFVINGTILAESLNYPNYDNIDYLLGSKYIPLRKEFWQSNIVEVKNNIKRILITTGGNDLRNLTPKILKKLNEEFPYIKKKVIIADNFNNISEIEDIANDNVELIFSPDAQGMKKAMLSSDLAISAAGQTLYELARVGLPTIAIEVIENQKNNIKNWLNEGFIEFAGSYDNNNLIGNIVDKIELLKDYNLRKIKQSNGLKAVDGKGSLRIAKKILSKFYQENAVLRDIKKSDCLSIFEIANDYEVRKSSFNSDKISFEEHKKWFSNILTDSSVKFLIFEYDESIIGQLRFDFDEEYPVISISLNKRYRGLNLAKLFLSKSLIYLNNNYDYDKVVAYIKKDNIKSISFFESMGFKLEKEIMIKENKAFKYYLSL